MIQTPPEGNRWLNTTALFTIAELIGPECFRTATIEDLRESLTARIFHLWNIPLSFSFFTLRLLGSDGQPHDLHHGSSL